MRSTFNGSRALSLSELSELLKEPQAKLLSSAYYGSFDKSSPVIAFYIKVPKTPDVYIVTRSLLNELDIGSVTLETQRCHGGAPSKLQQADYLLLSPHVCMKLYQHGETYVSTFENAVHFDKADLVRFSLSDYPPKDDKLLLTFGKYKSDRSLFTKKEKRITTTDIVALVWDLSTFVDFRKIEIDTAASIIRANDISRPTTPEAELLKHKLAEPIKWDKPTPKPTPDKEPVPAEELKPLEWEISNENNDHSKELTRVEKIETANPSENNRLLSTDSPDSEESPADNTNAADDKVWSKSDFPDDAENIINCTHRSSAPTDLLVLLNTASSLWNDKHPVTNTKTQQTKYPKLEIIAHQIFNEFNSKLPNSITTTDCKQLAALIRPKILKHSESTEKEKIRNGRWINGWLFALFEVSSKIQNKKLSKASEISSEISKRTKIPTYMLTVATEIVLGEFLHNKMGDHQAPPSDPTGKTHSSTNKSQTPSILDQVNQANGILPDPSV